MTFSIVYPQLHLHPVARLHLCLLGIELRILQFQVPFSAYFSITSLSYLLFMYYLNTLIRILGPFYAARTFRFDYPNRNRHAIAIPNDGRYWTRGDHNGVYIQSTKFWTGFLSNTKRPYPRTCYLVVSNGWKLIIWEGRCCFGVPLPRLFVLQPPCARYFLHLAYTCRNTFLEISSPETTSGMARIRHSTSPRQGRSRVF